MAVTLSKLAPDRRKVVAEASEEALGVMATYTPGDNVGEHQDCDQDEQGCLDDQNDRKSFFRKKS